MLEIYTNNNCSIFLGWALQPLIYDPNPITDLVNFSTAIVAVSRQRKSPIAAIFLFFFFPPLDQRLIFENSKVQAMSLSIPFFNLSSQLTIPMIEPSKMNKKFRQSSFATRLAESTPNLSANSIAVRSRPSFSRALGIGKQLLLNPNNYVIILLFLFSKISSKCCFLLLVRRRKTIYRILSLSVIDPIVGCVNLLFVCWNKLKMEMLLPFQHLSDSQCASYCFKFL